MKKTNSFLLAVWISLFVITACDKKEISSSDQSETEITQTSPSESETSKPEISEPESEPIIAPVKELIINGIPVENYVISINESLGGTIIKAASELQKYIKLTTGVLLPIEKSVVSGSPRILIDQTEYAIDDSRWEIFTDKDGIVLSGYANRGSLYVVYHFLEQFLNWRFFSSDTEVCYEADSIELKDISYQYEHPYKIREYWDVDMFANEISVKRYQNGSTPTALTDRLEVWGGTTTYTPLGIHNFGTLSEYGAQLDQPCLNNPTIRANFIKNVRAGLDANYTYWGREYKTVQISQNDNQRYCTCNECMADIEYYGTPAGSIIELMNLIAEDLQTYNGGKYKDVYVVTFAYQYSLDCPSNIVCHPKVMIEFTLIDRCFQHAINDPECTGMDEYYPNIGATHSTRSNAEVVEEMEKWAEICEHCYLYDYAYYSRFYYAPWPYIYNIYDDYKYFSKIDAYGYINLAQGNSPRDFDGDGVLESYTYNAEFGVLRQYLICMMTENPNMTREEFNQHLEEFLKAYYGSAWELAKEYLDFLENMSNEFDGCFGLITAPELIYGDYAFRPYNEYLVELFGKMLSCNNLTEMQLLHINRLKVSADYMRLGHIFSQEMESGDPERVEAMKEANKTFYHTVQNLGMCFPVDGLELPDYQSINWESNIRTWMNKHYVHYYQDK